MVSSGTSRGVKALSIGLALWVLLLGAGLVVLVDRDGFGGTTYGPDFWEAVEVQRTGDGQARVGLIEITGEIFGGSGSPGGLLSSGFLAADDYISQLRQAGEDDGIKGVVLRVDSPGGAVVASDRIYRAVKELNRKKPVIAVLEDTAASGGLYVAAGAREVITHPATITGSIGVIAIFPNVEKAAGKLGVDAIVIKSGSFKDMGSPLRKMSRAERRILQDLIDEAYAGFVDVVAEGRKLSREKVLKLADGRIYTGKQAVAAGLADKVGGLEDGLNSVVREAQLDVADGARLERFVPPALGLGDLLGARGGLDVPRALGQAREELTGIPSRSGLHYLWLR